MSKVVTIPDYTRPNWVCCINGVRYAYPAGSTQEVPDEVADLIEDQMEQVPVPDPVPEPVQPGGGVSGWNDLPDKPFYEEENAVLLPETQFAPVGELDGATMFGIEGIVDFVIGKTYTVNWNGVDYETECFLAEYNEEPTPMLGNPGAVGLINNNLPFVIACTGGMIGAIPLDGSTAVTLSISGDIVQKLEEKFAPACAVPFWVDVINTDGTYTTAVTAVEIFNAHKNERLIMARIREAGTATAYQESCEIMHLGEIGGNVYALNAEFTRIADTLHTGRRLQVRRLLCQWSPDGGATCTFTSVTAADSETQ